MKDDTCYSIENHVSILYKLFFAIKRPLDYFFVKYVYMSNIHLLVSKSHWTSGIYVQRIGLYVFHDGFYKVLCCYVSLSSVYI